MTEIERETSGADSLAAHSAANPPTKQTLYGLDWVNFFLADVQTGVGPFLAIYLASFAWNTERVGLALTVGGIAGIATQTPVGGIVDRSKSKRMLVAVGVIALAIGALVIAFFPQFWPVMAAQALIGGVSSIFLPTIAAMSLGIVGAKLFDRRQGRNQTFNSAGNVVAALLAGVVGYYSNRAIFFLVVAFIFPTLLTLKLIRPEEIDNDLARNANQEEGEAKAAGIRELFRDRPLVIFLVCAVLFHFANATMLPLLGEMLAKGKGASSMMFMSACIITTQIVITCIASPSGRLAGSLGRKPLLLIAFGVLPIRGLLYTLTGNTYFLVAIQILDGIAAGIFGVVSILVIADLTRGTGRFNLTQGAIATAVGIGASLSQVIAGSIVHHSSNRLGFLFLAGVAVAALALFWLFMPETNGRTAKDNACDIYECARPKKERQNC